MNLLKTISSLEEKASAKLAIHLCQEKCFKEISLCVELKDPTVITNGPHESIYCDKVYTDDEIKIKKWDASVEEQCQKLTEGLNGFLKRGVQTWMNRIALENLSFSRRQEGVFGAPCYFWMDFLSNDDYTETCRLNERKIAERLLKDKRLTVLQRYRIACVYCLLENISELRNKLTATEKALIYENIDIHSIDRLIRIWTFNWDGGSNDNIMQQGLLTDVVKGLIAYGNLAIVVPFWRQLEEHVQQGWVTGWAVNSLKKWQYTKQKSVVCKILKKKPAFNELNYRRFKNYFNLPYHYTELMYFFLTEMHEEQQLSFFEQSFQRDLPVLECFLDWPLQNYFLSTINRLWGKVPMNLYIKCLSALVNKYSGNYTYIGNFSDAHRRLSSAEENCNYNYRNLLGDLWEKTPKEYKQFVFSVKNIKSDDGTMKMLCRFVKKSPFHEKDENLFKRILCYLYYLPQEERTSVMYFKYTQHMYCILIQKGKWSLVDWFLEQCLGEGSDIKYFKKHFVKSFGRNICYSESHYNHEEILEELFNWALLSDSEKNSLKDDLIDESNCFDPIKRLMCDGKFAVVEGLINFCIASDEKKYHFKVHMVYRICSVLLQKHKWKKMDDILSWCFKTKKEIGNFKKSLFSCEGMKMQFTLSFNKKQFKTVENLYEWFQLSAAKIKKIKKDAVFSSCSIQYIKDWLHSDEDTEKNEGISYEFLNWCLADEKMVNDFKQKIEEECYDYQVSYEKSKIVKERLENLVQKLLSRFRNDVKDKTLEQISSVQNKREKRSAVCNESKPPKKRFK